MTKDWFSFQNQVELLAERGMEIVDRDQASEFLSKVNYFRFEGYFRYWQHDPQHGDNRFIEGTRLENSVICISRNRH